MGKLCWPKDALFYLPDLPSNRSLHSKTRSRSGGIAIASGISAGALFLAPSFSSSWIFALSALGIFTISLLDDIYDIFCLYRFAIHLCAALLLFYTGLMPELPTWFIILATTWMINLYNFMDGMDGFAGSMAFIGFGTCAIIGYSETAYTFAIWNGIITTSAFGFLIYNFPPAKMFMGDSGACLFGFLAAATALVGAKLEILPIWVSLLIWSPFVVDATTTLIGRIFRLEKIWIGQRNHFYHKLLLRWGHQRTLFCYVMIMIAVATTALITRKTDWSTPITYWGIFYALFFKGINIYAKKVPITAKW